MTLRQRLTGLGALIVLASILLGLPALLVALGGNPLPRAVPSIDEVRDALLTPDDGTLALTGARLLGWLVWAALSASIVTESISALRGVRVPILPALSLLQIGMRPLVIAALALFVAAPGATAPAASAAPSAITTVSASAPRAAAADATLTPTTPVVAAPPAIEPEHRRLYVVRPGDTLWSIAEHHLGSGQDYHRIVDLNREHLSGGADCLTPGMVLQLPATEPTSGDGEQADHAHHVVVETGDTLSALAAEHLGDAARWPEIYEASTRTVQPDGRRLSDPDLIHPGWLLNLPGSPGTEEQAQQAPTSITTVARSSAATSSALGTQVDTPEQTPAQPEQHPGEAGASGGAAAQSSPALGASVGVTMIGDAAGRAGPNTSGDRGDVPVDAGRNAPGDSVDGSKTATDVEQEDAPAWLLEGIAGSGALLGGALFLALTLRRRCQFRTRRPGRALAAPDPVMAPVEKTIQTRGRSAAPTLEQLDQTLRRLGAACAATGAPVPAVAAVHLSGDGTAVHLRQPTSLDSPWQDAGDGQHWFLPAETPMDSVGPAREDSPAPFPLLVSIGAADDGSAWLLNLEDLEVALTGQVEYVQDLARYLAAEVAVNPWSTGVRLDCVGIASEVAPMNPTRVRVADTDALEDLVADVVSMIDRVGQGQVPTARVRHDGEDTWPARLVLLSSDGSAPAATAQLRQLLAQHPGSTSAALIIHSETASDTALQIDATAQGLIRIPAAGLDLVGVGLTADEAAGCAALLAHARTETDVPMPAASTDVGEHEQTWRDWSDQAGALRPEHTVDREAPAEEDTATLLPEEDDAYEQKAATTAEDLSILAPRVEPDIARKVLDTDATLDADLAAWHNPAVRVPRLTLLGPVKATTWGRPLGERKAYLTELLAYLALHPNGVTTAQTAEAFGTSEAKIRDYIARAREWLGTNPATGDLHIPHAQDAPATRTRGVNLYQVLGLLIDIDLFRRLRTRANVRGGTEGIEDLKAALRLVQGRPFDQLRRGGWAWLFEGDRVDHHITCAVVDVAHLVATHDLHTGDLTGARAAAEIAFLAAPHEEIPTLDLATVTAREGHTHEAIRLLQTDICNRTDDPDQPPGELPERTQQILDRHAWLQDRRYAG